MPPLNANDLHRIFERLDQNGLLERFGIQSSSKELESLVGNTSLDLLDFYFFYDIIIKQKNGDKERASEENKSLEGDLAEAFEVYDLNGDGFIPCEELQNVLSRLGMWNEQSGRDCNSMIKMYDAYSDGLLDFEEFKNMMLLTNS
ncbi:hypothetical protein NMG60_11032851 [Bertholletia excelsa]